MKRYLICVSKAKFLYEEVEALDMADARAKALEWTDELLNDDPEWEYAVDGIEKV